MCGIVGYIGARKAAPIILDGLKRLEYRGYDSAGIAVVGDDCTLTVHRAPGKLRNLEDVVRMNPLDGFRPPPGAPGAVRDGAACWRRAAEALQSVADRTQGQWRSAAA